MSILTKFSLKNRAAIVIMVFLVTVLGVYSGSRLPMELLPSVDAPMITVTTFGVGMDAETVTEEITEPLERQLKNGTYLDSMTSSTSEGISMITLNYTSEADMKEAASEAEKLINQVQLPQNTGKPVVSQLNFSMIPLAQVALESENGFTKADEERIEEEIKTKFEDIDGVSSVTFYGKSISELSVKIDPEKMIEKNVSADQLMMALQSQNASVPAGEIAVDGKANAIRVLGEVTDETQIENAILAPDTKIKDIADVSIRQFYEADARLNGKEALVLVIFKEASKNAVEIGKEVDRKAEELHEIYSDDFSIRTVQNTSEDVEGAVLGMAKEVAIGAIAATLIILLFLRNIRTTLIAVVSIPLSILMTLFLLDQSGITLNILTLGGLAVAVGRLVDDSIVVIENIYRRIQTEGLSKEVILSGTKEVSTAITSSTLTTIAVFLPIGLVGGSIGEIMTPLILSVVYSILASLLVALTVVPLLSFVLLKKVKQKEHQPSVKYASILKWSLNHKWIVLVAALLIFVGSIFTFTAIPQASVNSQSESFVNVSLTYPADYDLEEAKEKAGELEQELLKEDKLKDLFYQMGSTAEDAKYGQVLSEKQANYSVIFEKGKDVEGFLDMLKEISKEYAPGKIEGSQFSFGSFGGGNGIQLNVTASNEEDLAEAGKLAAEELEKIEGIEKVKSNYEDLKNEWIVNVDQEKAGALGLSPVQIGQQIRAMLNKTPLGQIKVGGEQLQAVIEYEDADFSTTKQVLNTYVTSPVAGPVQLKQVAEIEEQEIKTQVYHQDGKETIQISGEISAEDLKTAGMKIDQMTKEIDLPEGAAVTISGATESMQDDFADLFKMMGIAVLVVYLIMVITFGQARAPFAILFSLPLAAVGGILGLVISQTPVDINALLGALMLIGIVVTNAIVLIERVQQNREKGLDIREALLEAGSTRLRPIIMTAVTTIVALTPMVFSATEAASMVSRSLAVVVIGGLIVSTALTLVVVPVMYELLAKMGRRRKKKKDVAEDIGV
ncbi:efflux RND transporter permease subunit [Metabacillus idriensis]|uniref:efflux RND transporter permease subunit n=1 Tax=Metabacillus idriensis TaxID=324768 RepID=UPI003D2DF195